MHRIPVRKGVESEMVREAFREKGEVDPVWLKSKDLDRGGGVKPERTLTWQCEGPCIPCQISSI